MVKQSGTEKVVTANFRPQQYSIVFYFRGKTVINNFEKAFPFILQNLV